MQHRAHALDHAVARAEPHRAHGQDALPLQLDGAAVRVAARRPNVRVPRRQRALPHDRPRHAPGRRSRPTSRATTRRRRASAARRSRTRAPAARCTARSSTIEESPHDANTHLRGHGRRARPAHARRRRDVDERHAARRGRRARERDRGVAARSGHGVSRVPHGSPRATTRRTSSAPPTTARTWTRIVNGLRGGRAGARGARGSGASRTALRGHGDGRVRLVRRRRALAALLAQPARACR